ncbi:tetratricopeptide repeat protein [Candidatus Desantisbacteria bacterium]|nr:tetratricopeptide repeat protein [Candidatus Desantisbacteria bacterium]
MKKIKFGLLLIVSILLFVWSQQAYAKQIISAIPHDRAVDIYWAIPKYNPDGSPCSDLAGVFLFRSISKDGPFSLVNPKVVPPNQRWWHDDQKINRIKYFYKIKAVDDVGNLSDFSPMIEVIPSGDDVPPEPVEIFVKCCQTPPDVEISWSPSVDDKGLSHYNIYRSLTEIKDEYLSRNRKGMPSLIEPAIKVDASNLKFIDKKAKPGTVYYYNVTAVDTSDNESKASNTIFLRVCGNDISAPIVESVSEDTYNKPKKTGKEITVVLVGEAKLAASYTLGQFAVELPMKETAKPGTYFAIYTVKPGDNGTLIPLSGKLIDPAGNITEKKGENTITIDTIPPAPVKDLTASTGFDTTFDGKKMDVFSKVELKWGKSDDAEYYKIYRYNEPITEQNISKAFVIAKHLSNDTLYYKDRTATPGQVVYYTTVGSDLAENEAVVSSCEIKVAADSYPPNIAKVVEDTLGIPQKAGNRIQVVLYGEPSCIALFDVGSKITGVPMNEVLIGSVHTGTYSGSYVIKEDDDVDNIPVLAHLRDAFGNESILKTETGITIKTHSTDTTPPEITKIFHNSKGIVLVENPEEGVLTVTMEGEPDGIAFFDIGTMVRGIKLYQTETKGVYEGSYKVVKGDNIGNAKITGYLSDASGNVSTKICDDPVTIDTSVRINVQKEPAIEFLTADSTSTVGIVAIVNDAHNKPITGRKIEFSLISNYGTVTTVNSITDKDGKAKGQYQAGMVVQTAYICAEDVETGAAGITYIKMTKSTECQITLRSMQRRFRTSNGIYYIDMDAHPERITADGASVSIITATIRKIGESGKLGPKKSEETPTNINTDERIKGEKVKFTITSHPDDSPGSLRIHPKYLDVVADGSITDDNGEAKAIYTAGTKIGLTIIHAVAPLSPDKGEPIAEMVGILLIAGEVRYLTIIAKPALLDADGKSTSNITVKAEDSFNNPCRDINVSIEIIPPLPEAGKIGVQGSGQQYTTNETGEAVAVYTAGIVPGKVTIRATVSSNTPIDDAVASYAQGKYEQAITVFKAAIAEYPQDNWTDDLYYMMGYSEELLNYYNDSINSYNEVVRFYFGGPWADNALYRTGQVYEKMGDYSKAIDAYTELINNSYLLESREVYKNNLIDNALFRMGVMYERLEHYVMAKKCYIDLIDRFKDTDENALIADAERALEILRASGY